MSAKHPVVGWIVRGTVAVVALGVVAHVRHETVPQLVGGAVTTAGTLVNQITDSAGTGFTAPDITIAPTSGRLPARLTVSGTGYQPHEKIDITGHTTVLATPVADNHGAFSTTVVVPADTFCPHGQCTVTAQGKDSVKWTTAPYNVTR